MSLIVTGTDLSIALFFLIALNGFFCYKKMPVLAIPIALVSMLFIIGFSISFTGLTVILTLVLAIFIFGNLISNYNSYRRK